MWHGTLLKNLMFAQLVNKFLAFYGIKTFFIVLFTGIWPKPHETNTFLHAVF